MNIATCFNKEYIEHFLVMALSLIGNNKDSKIEFHIIHEGLQKNEITIIQNEFKEYLNIKFNFYESDFTQIKFLPLSTTDLPYLSYETYGRLLLAEILPINIDKVLYLDSDLIIRGNISELYSLEFDDKLVAAVCDMNLDITENLSELDSFMDYFNAGVILIDLKEFRELNLSQLFLKFARENMNRLKYADQDVLNYILKGKWYRLNLKWNVTRNVFYNKKIEVKELNFEIDEALKNPIIIHFTGSSKPWHYFDNHPFKKEYFYYKNQLNTKFEEYPEYKLLKEKNIIIFGTGEKGKQDFHFLKNYNIDVQYFMDNDKNKWGKLCCDKLILAPTLEKITSIKKPLILISSQYFMEIGHQLKDLELLENKDYFLNLNEMINYLQS